MRPKASSQPRSAGARVVDTEGSVEELIASL
jgi:hypothetical protein